jgi:hypothetical protein
MDLVRYSAAARSASDLGAEISVLTDALLACTAMQDRPARDTILQLLGDIGNSVKRRATNKLDVFNILWTCLQYEDGIHRLFNAISWVDQETIAVNNLAKVFGETFGEIFGTLPNGLTNKHLSGLKQKLDGMEFNWAGVQDAFNRIMPGSEAPTHKEPVRAFATMIWMAATQLRLEPIIRFAQALGDLNPDVRPGIDDWLTEMVKHFPDVAAVVNTPAPVSKLPIKQPCLQIAIDWREDSPREAREINDATPVRVITVLWLNDHNHHLVTSDAISLEAVPAFVQGAVKLSRERVQLQPITIEVFLPLLLLKMYPVEQWHFNDDFDDSWWGYDYEIVVRSLDRIKHRIIHQNLDPHWTKKWEHLLDMERRVVDGEPIITDENMVWVCSCVPQDINAHSIRMKPVTTVGAAVLVEVDRIPRVPHRQSSKEFIHYLLLSGVPMAFWLRNTLDGMDIASIEAEFRQLIHTTPPHQLAARLRERRENASLDEIWWHIAHMWENPDRIADELIPKTLNIQSERRSS